MQEDKNFFLLSKQPFITKTKTVFMWLFRIAAVMWLVSSAFYVLYLLFSSVVEVLEFSRFKSFEFFFPSLLSNLIKIIIFSSFILTCYLFLAGREEYKKHLRRFAFIVSVLHLFPITVVAFSIIEKTSGVILDVPWIFNEWKGYKAWFFIIPETTFWWRIFFTSTMLFLVSYISLCVYSDRYCIPFSEKIKKYWLRINLSVFWLLFLFYPLFQVFCNFYPCDNKDCVLRDNPPRTISHYIGIYGFLSSPANSCVCPPSARHSKYKIF